MAVSESLFSSAIWLKSSNHVMSLTIYSVYFYQQEMYGLLKGSSQDSKLQMTSDVFWRVLSLFIQFRPGATIGLEGSHREWTTPSWGLTESEKHWGRIWDPIANVSWRNRERSTDTTETRGGKPKQEQLRYTLDRKVSSGCLRRQQVTAQLAESLENIML